MECAITAAKRGHSVTVFEKGDRIGGSLFGYATLDLARPDDLLSVVRHYETMAQKLGIDMRLRTEANARFMRSMLHQYDVCVVAAGAGIDLSAHRDIDGHERIVDAMDVVAAAAKPGRDVVVIGGGKIGLVVAEALAKSGARVTIVEAGKRIAGDVMPSFKWRHSAWVDELGVRVCTSSRVLRIGETEVVVADLKGVETTVSATTVIAAGPRKSNQDLFREFEWMVDELHGCGDALIPRGLDAAISEGYRLGARI